jgi:inhibitor of cysteine peptidase
MMKLFAVVALLFCLCIGMALGDNAGAKDQGGSHPGIEGRLEGQTIELAVGQSHTVTLESNPTTGYQWQIASPLDERILKLVHSGYKKPDTKLLGAGGVESWTFQAVGRGNTRIVMKYVRPWEKDVSPAKTVSFNVIVK